MAKNIRCNPCTHIYWLWYMYLVCLQRDPMRIFYDFEISLLAVLFACIACFNDTNMCQSHNLNVHPC